MARDIEALTRDLLANLTPTEKGCLEYLKKQDKDGYGFVGDRWADGMKAHRLAYQVAHGEIPKGLYVLHHCDNPPCCNPDHLFAGTPQDNVDDMRSKGRGRYWKRGVTHCIHGHEFTPDNIVSYPNHTKRKCAECNRKRCREYQAKRRAAAKAEKKRQQND